MIKLVRLLSFLSMSLAMGAWASAEKLDALPEAAVKNPAVRDHFRRVAVEARAYIRADGRRVYRRDFFLEERVDRLVRSFLTELNQRRTELKDSMEMSEKARERRLRNSGAGREAERIFKGSLKELSRRAGRLRSLLRPLLSDFDSKSDYAARVQEGFEVGRFESEMRFLRGEVDAVDRLIDGFFFEPSFTVDAGSLRDGNMLVRLHRVQRMAEALTERLR